MTSKRKFLFVGGAVIVLILTGLVHVGLGVTIKSAVEKIGPQITKTELRLGLVTLSPLTGRARLRNLHMGNPAGFETPFAIRMKDFKVSLSVRSLFSDRIVIRNVVIREPEISYESNSSGNNLKTIQKNVESFAPSQGGEGKSPSKKIVIESLTIEKGRLFFKPKLVGGEPIEIALPDIHMENIGKESNGIPPSEAVSAVMNNITNQSVSAVSQLGQQVGEGIKKSAEGIGKSLKGVFGR